MFTEFNISRNYSKADIRTISPSVVNQVEKILCFKQMADYLINIKYRERGITTEEESQRIMALAANLVKAEVRQKAYKTISILTQGKLRH